MLKNEFYTIVETACKPAGMLFTIRLNEKHVIYNGHFPGQPVVPGACLLQITEELAETTVGKKLKLVVADELKFLIPINPVEDNVVQADIISVTTDEGNMRVAAVFFLQQSSPCFKCRAVFAHV